MIQELSHITLICKDLEKSTRFLQEILGAKQHYATDKKIYSVAKERFFKVGDIWIVIMQGEKIDKSYNHIAFQIDHNSLHILREKIVALGLEILPGRSRTKEEGDSIYFYDYDNHLFELHSGNLEKRLEYYNALDHQNHGAH